MRKTKLALACTLILTSALSKAYSEEVKTKGIEVTATRVERDLLQVPVSVSVVSEKQIKKSGASTIGDLLKDVPGVEVNNDGSQGLKRIGIRGEDAYRTLVLVDGQKISEHKSMSGTPMLIDPASVERIEVIKGPNSVLYGSDAIGGVINIITKKNADKPFTADIAAGYDGSGDAWRESAGVSGKVSGVGYRLGAANVEAGNLRVPHKVIEGTSYRQKSFDGLLSYDFSDKVTLGVNGEYFDSDINSTTEDTGSYDDFGVEIPVWKRSKVNMFAELKNLTDTLARVRVDAYHQVNQKIMANRIKQSESSSSTTVKTTPIGSITTQKELLTSMSVNSGAKNTILTNAATAQTEWTLGDSNYLIAGAGVENDSFTSETTTKGHMDMTVDVKMSGMVNQNVHQNVSQDVVNNRGILSGGQKTIYGFLSNETQLPFDLVANYGLRYTKVKSNADTNLKVNNLNGLITSSETGDSTNNRTVFNAGLVWNGLEDTAVRFNFGQGFRAPILQERYFSTSMGGATVYGNPDLKAETSNSYELGIRHASDKFFADVSAFLTKSKNFIATKETVSNLQALRQYYNVASAKTFGLETVLSYDFETGITPYTSITYMRRRFDNDSSILGSTYDTNTPKLITRLGLRYEHDFGNWTLNTDAYARSQSARNYTKVVEDAVATTHQGGFTTGNFEVSGSFGEKRQYVVTAGWLNIFNKRYYTTDAIAEPGSHGFVTVSAKF